MIGGRGKQTLSAKVGTQSRFLVCGRQSPEQRRLGKLIECLDHGRKFLGFHGAGGNPACVTSHGRKQIHGGQFALYYFFRGND